MSIDIYGHHFHESGLRFCASTISKRASARSHRWHLQEYRVDNVVLGGSQEAHNGPHARFSAHSRAKMPMQRHVIILVGCSHECFPAYAGSTQLGRWPGSLLNNLPGGSIDDSEPLWCRYVVPVSLGTVGNGGWGRRFD
jgi:hypothetical protein